MEYSRQDCQYTHLSKYETMKDENNMLCNDHDNTIDDSNNSNSNKQKYIDPENDSQDDSFIFTTIHACSSSWDWIDIDEFKILQMMYLRADVKALTFDFAKKRTNLLKSFYNIRDKYTMKPTDIEQINYHRNLQILLNHLYSVVTLHIPTTTLLNSDILSIEFAIESILDVWFRNHQDNRDEEVTMNKYIAPCLDYSWFVPWLPFYYSDT